jgi:sugar phosphate isomerase/epimerase
MTMLRVTRREFNHLVLGGLAAMPLTSRSHAQTPDSTVAGVRIGAQSYSFRDRSLDETIAAMRSVGLAFCELWQGHVETRERINVAEGGNRRDALRAWRLSAPLDEFREIRRKFDAAGITLTAYNLSFRDDFTDAEIRRGFEMARALGVDVITASSTVSVVPRLGPGAREFGIKVGLHNHSKIAPNELATPEDFAAAVESTKGRPDMIAVNLDIGHFTAANFDALDYLDEHHDRIVSLHIKDRRRDQGPNVAFGDGDTPIVAVLRRLRDRRWPIPAQIEYEYRGADTIEEVRRCFDYCRAALEKP